MPVRKPYNMRMSNIAGLVGYATAVVRLLRVRLVVHRTKEGDHNSQRYSPQSIDKVPARCFSGQVPTPACAATVPHSRTGYDEGINGVAIAWYDNGSLTGAPKVYTTGTGTADGRLANVWAAVPTTGSSALGSPRPSCSGSDTDMREPITSRISPEHSAARREAEAGVPI